MAYKVNGKVYTDHPLMDEIVHNCKLIMDGIVVKNQTLANRYETEETLNNAEIYKILHDNGSISFDVFPFTREVLAAYGYTEAAIDSYIVNKENIPKSDRNDLMEFVAEYVPEHFEEKNDYYRMLTGLPPYNTGTQYYIYIDDTYLPSGFDREVDFTVPLHELDKYVLDVLYSTGKMNEIREEYQGSKYSYINFLGPKKLDLYTVRTAKQWDILYIPSVYYMVKDRFEDIYKINQDIYLNTVYQDAYAYNSDYYEQMCIIMLLAQTFNDMVVDVPEWYIRRDIFDLRSVQYFLESYGVDFYKEIPLKYQIRIVKNINKLIKYKSSNKNFKDILEVFSLEDAKIHKYYLYKHRLMDKDGVPVEGETDDEKYELKFIISEYDKSFDQFINNQINIKPYDDITYEDKYWDGEDTHSYIKSQIINQDFTIQGTKFMDIEYEVDMSKYNYQMSYLLGLILDSKADMDDIRISVPSLNAYVPFKVSDLFLLLCILSQEYYAPDTSGSSMNVRIPEFKELSPEKTPYFMDLNGGESGTEDDDYDIEVNGNITTRDNGTVWQINADGGDAYLADDARVGELFYDWKKEYLPEIYVDKKRVVLGFNPDVNIDELKNVLRRRHSKFRFGSNTPKYGPMDSIVGEDYQKLADDWIKRLKLDDYIRVDRKFESTTDIIETYRNNTKIYENLKALVDNCDNESEYATLMYVYRQLFTKTFDDGFYTLSDGSTAKNLKDVLKDRNYILYNSYTTIMSDSNNDSRKDAIRNIENDIVDTLEYYFQGDGLESLFGFTSVASFESLLHYIYLMLNFFKSYKVYFLDPVVTYNVNNKNSFEDGKSKSIDVFTEIRELQDEYDRAQCIDAFSIKMEEDVTDSAYSISQREIVDIDQYYIPDLAFDYDLDGMNAADGEKEGYVDIDGGFSDTIGPFFDINGGNAHGGKFRVFDLNGAGAAEPYHGDISKYNFGVVTDDPTDNDPQYQNNMDFGNEDNDTSKKATFFIDANKLEKPEVLDIDGGFAYNPYDQRRDWFGTQGFNYVIDGGYASDRLFITKTVRLEIVNRALKADLRLSERSNNGIELKDDGIYCNLDNYIDHTSIDNAEEEFNRESEAAIEEARSKVNQVKETTFDQEVIVQLTDNILNPMLQSINDNYAAVTNSTMKRNVRAYMDQAATNLRAKYIK